MRWNELDSEACPVARGLSVIGDRWNLLILRDCFLGVRRFDHFQENLGITRHVLADRLKNLQAAGVLKRKPYQDRPVRYEYRLTDKGKDLYPTLISLMKWADAHVPSDKPPPYSLVSRETGKPVQPTLYDENTGQPLTLRSLNLVPTTDDGSS